MKQVPASLLPRPTRNRSGCLRPFLLLFVGLLVVLALYVVIAPWGFYLGGQFHPLAYWQGWGTVHSPDGDYVVFMRMFPRTRGRGGYLSGPSVQGSGAICSPQGETYPLRLTGGFTNGRIGVNTDGEAMSLYLTERLNFLGTNGSTRLSVSLHGAWHDPDLVLDESGSFTSAFNPDGTRYSGDPRKRRQHGTPLLLTLHEGSRGDFDAACAAARKR